MYFVDGSPPPCHDDLDLFFGTVEDGRMEPGREDREAIATSICRTTCPYRLKCLEDALVKREPYGVWGGMGEGERRKFATHLKIEGYGNDIPHGLDLQASVYVWYRIHPVEDIADEPAPSDTGLGLVIDIARHRRMEAGQGPQGSESEDERRHRVS